MKYILSEMFKSSELMIGGQSGACCFREVKYVNTAE